MNIRKWLSGILVLALFSAIGNSADNVNLVRNNDSVAVTIGGKEFTTYRFAKSLPKPHFFPLKSIDNVMLTRPIVGEDFKGDHPHHKGMWFTHGDVNGIDFWKEGADAGKIVVRW